MTSGAFPPFPFHSLNFTVPFGEKNYIFILLSPILTPIKYVFDLPSWLQVWTWNWGSWLGWEKILSISQGSLWNFQPKIFVLNGKHHRPASFLLYAPNFPFWTLFLSQLWQPNFEDCHSRHGNDSQGTQVEGYEGKLSHVWNLWLLSEYFVISFLRSRKLLLVLKSSCAHANC